ncbi:MAG: tRNA (adenosine(37)-N6)-dimethylallyltransferase MiaA [Vampirovibrionales bacterium]|nr:tRNA (adenosine(37)-N6)-dimethylallyltransferase MiaA [Vampirovibrionales bacterium]
MHVGPVVTGQVGRKARLNGPLVVLVGPTATGKSRLGVLLAKALMAAGQPASIVSADSRLVYRELTIGTAKPTPDEQQGIPHAMIDCVPPDAVFSAAQYAHQAYGVLCELWQQQILPIIVGGTGFYLQALLQGHNDALPPVSPNPTYRNALQTEIEQSGLQTLYLRLQAQDPQRAVEIYPTDAFRIIRALEIIEFSGQKASSFKAPALEVPKNQLWFGLGIDDRTLLHARIALRTQAMFSAGWLKEVEGLLARYGPQAPALQATLGYPELVAHLQNPGAQPLSEVQEKIVILTRQYARRQLTWFKRNPAILWTPVDPWLAPALPEPERARLDAAWLDAAMARIRETPGML